MPYYLINGCKLDRGIVLKLSLKVPLGVPYGLTKEVKHFGFFGKEIVIINAELSLYLNPLILKVGSIPLDSSWGLGSLTDFNYFIIISVLPGVSYLVKLIGRLGLLKGGAELLYRAIRLSRISYRVSYIL